MLLINSLVARARFIASLLSLGLTGPMVTPVISIDVALEFCARRLRMRCLIPCVRAELFTAKPGTAIDDAFASATCRYLSKVTKPVAVNTWRVCQPCLSLGILKLKPVGVGCRIWILLFPMKAEEIPPRLEPDTWTLSPGASCLEDWPELGGRGLIDGAGTESAEELPPLGAAGGATNVGPPDKVIEYTSTAGKRWPVKLKNDETSAAVPIAVFERPFILVITSAVAATVPVLLLLNTPISMLKTLAETFVRVRSNLYQPLAEAQDLLEVDVSGATKSEQSAARTTVIDPVPVCQLPCKSSEAVPPL